MTWKIAGEIGKVVAAPLVGGIFSSKASNKAGDLSAKANADALAFEKQKYAEETALAKAQWDAEQARLAPRRALKDAMLRAYAAKHGVTLPDNYSSGPQPFPGVGGDLTSQPNQIGNALNTHTMTLGMLAGKPTYDFNRIQPSTPALAAPPTMTLGDLGRKTNAL